MIYRPRQFQMGTAFTAVLLLPHFRLVSRRLFQLIVSLSPYSYPNFCIEMYLARFQRLCWLR